MTIFIRLDQEGLEFVWLCSEWESSKHKLWSRWSLTCSFIKSIWTPNVIYWIHSISMEFTNCFPREFDTRHQKSKQTLLVWWELVGTKAKQNILPYSLDSVYCTLNPKTLINGLRRHRILNNIFLRIGTLFSGAWPFFPRSSSPILFWDLICESNRTISRRELCGPIKPCPYGQFNLHMQGARPRPWTWLFYSKELKKENTCPTSMESPFYKNACIVTDQKVNEEHRRMYLQILFVSITWSEMWA